MSDVIRLVPCSHQRKGVIIAPTTGYPPPYYWCPDCCANLGPVTPQQHERLEADFKHASDQAALLRDQRDAETFRARSADAALNAVMQQHERLEAVVTAASEWAADIADAGFLAQTAMSGRPAAVRLYNAVAGYHSRATLDTAAPETPTDMIPSKEG